MNVLVEHVRDLGGGLLKVLTLGTVCQRETQPEAPPWNVIFRPAEEFDRADRANRLVKADKAEVVVAKAEAVDAKAEVVVARVEAVDAKAEAVDAKAEAIVARAEVVVAKADRSVAKVEAVVAKVEAVAVLIARICAISWASWFPTCR